MPPLRQAKPLEDLLVEQGGLAPAQIEAAKAQAAKSGLPLRRVVIQQGLLAEEDLARIVAAQAGLATIDLSNYLIKPEIIQLVPEPLARKHLLIPVFKIGDTLTMAMEDPSDFLAIDEVHRKTGCNIKSVVAGATSIRQAIDQYYGSSGTTAEVAQAIREASLPQQEEAAAKEAPVVRLVNLLILQAMKERASDIHIEPGEGTLRTRFRVDGVLQEMEGPPAHLHSTVVSRIKVLAGLDIAEKRKAQDGRFRLKLEGKELDLRVSTIPTQHGEKAVLRLLDSASLELSLDQLGLDEATAGALRKLIRLPWGILLVTGPTGSGKTTTLYAAMHLINSVDKNIITVEDPIEYQLPGVNQVQVNPKAEVTFASALRSFLRQDPDVILVGEIRDRETAEIAVQAALTGHLVFSTLHTNDAASSLTRLIEMGVEPFLIASSVMGVLAQRLVRKVCPKCREAYAPPADVAQAFKLEKGAQFHRGKGCLSCRKTGYKGRVGLFELMPMSEKIRTGVVAKAPAQTIRADALREGMRPLQEDGMKKVLAGVTTMEEVLRVTHVEAL